MTRTQLQLDDSTFQALRHRAYTERKSMSAVAREALRRGLGLEESANSPREAKLTFVSSGASGRKDISVRHDEALEKDFR